MVKILQEPLQAMRAPRVIPSEAILVGSFFPSSRCNVLLTLLIVTPRPRRPPPLPPKSEHFQLQRKQQVVYRWVSTVLRGFCADRQGWSAWRACPQACSLPRGVTADRAAPVPRARRCVRAGSCHVQVLLEEGNACVCVCAYGRRPWLGRYRVVCILNTPPYFPAVP